MDAIFWKIYYSVMELKIVFINPKDLFCFSSQLSYHVIFQYMTLTFWKFFFYYFFRKAYGMKYVLLDFDM